MKPNDYIKLDGNLVCLVRIPKNASRSMAQALGLHLPGAHKPAAMLKEQNQRKFKDAVAVACVRNPFERMVSWYEFHVGRYPVLYPSHGIDAFRQWVAKGCPHRFWMGHWASHPFEQWRWICDEFGEVLVDHVLHHDTLGRDWSAIFPDIELKEVNQSNHGDWRVYYDKTTADRVATLVHSDLMFFGYGRPL